MSRLPTAFLWRFERPALSTRTRFLQFVTGLGARVRRERPSSDDCVHGNSLDGSRADDEIVLVRAAGFENVRCSSAYSDAPPAPGDDRVAFVGPITIPSLGECIRGSRTT
jgi:hypothetical protein